MKSLLSLALVLSACSHHADPQTPAQIVASNTVDPTLPSWAPKSCTAYHVAVVKAVGCEELPQPMRTSIKVRYEAANNAWHDLRNAQLETIDQIGLLCAADVTYVQSQSSGRCDTASR